MTLTLGSILTATILDIAFGGEGVARHEDFVIFIPFVLVGEEVEMEITELKKRFARARLRRVLEPARERVEPRCPYFGDCGGCQYQHIEYSAQTQLKHKQIQDLLVRLGRCPPEVVAPVVPCPRPYGYRNRIMVRSQWDKFKQGLNIGFIRFDNRLVVDVQECPIAEPELNEQLRQVRAHPPPKGGLKVVLRIPPPGWHVPPDSFFQNNFHLLPELVRATRDRIESSGVRHLIDLYCGVGFFSLELADLVESFVGVELDNLAIKAARQNAASRGARHGDFLAGNADELLAGLLGRFAAERTAVLVDPPRKGCAPCSLELLQKVRPAQIIYVSCHPATLARDLNMLTAAGVYKIERIVPLDMFPQTQHVECVADLRLTTGRS